MTRDELNTAIERSGLSWADLQQMTREEIRAYYSPENYRRMFGAAGTPSDDDLAEIRASVLWLFV